ncbi:MAG: hypothetical protein ACLR5T_08530 [Veillonella sp.]
MHWNISVILPDEETLQLFLGPPLVDAFQEHCGLTFEQAEETYFKFRERYGTIGKFENKYIRIL